MKYILDTHTAIWALCGNDDKLSNAAKSIIADQTAELAISIASAWEIAIKISKGGNVADMGSVAVFLNKLHENGVDILGISEEEVRNVEALPYIHKDPFDRIIIATALSKGLAVISSDENVQKYSVNWVW
jgi:PIN domain nuclease of toxin-antitoxin system